MTTRLWHLIRRALASGTQYRVLPRARWDDLYPIDCTVFGPHLAAGTLVVRLPGDDGAEFLHPVATCFRILARLQLDDGLTRANRGTISAAVRELLAAQQEDGSWRYPVRVARYGVAPGWSSAMAQGLATSALLRSADALPAAEAAVARSRVDAAIAHLLRPVEDGGCTTYDADGLPFPEECPATPAPHILNGAGFALLGLHDYDLRFGGDAAARTARRLNDLLPRWDIGYYSRYDMLGRSPSSPDYHRLHIALLLVFEELYGMEFGIYARRFHDYERRLRSRLRARVMLAVDRLLITRE
ncbi:D-glucuronyl C5-epimerase family protein [Ruania halotolerans]|uniref:D-glucuronyl C5-epimerase family protein n=1 Tax=Ruania halotolerans TaxID=2897773 RepID=UPI001E3EDA20|nr:D-glucuronyl C5-epimerase family protein [Ruania halotolerans]UFU07262.1 D-glucuronyl C5-epimerase family protein [Ruania halotolerans]